MRPEPALPRPRLRQWRPPQGETLPGRRRPTQAPHKSRVAACAGNPAAHSRPATGFPTRRCPRAAASHSAFEAALAPREVFCKATFRTGPVGPPRGHGARSGRPPAASASATSSVPPTRSRAPWAGGLPLKKKTLHLLHLLLMLPGEAVEEGSDPSAASSAASAIVACATSSAVAPSSSTHAAPVVAGEGAAGRLDGQKAPRRLAKAALPPVPRLVPRGDGGQSGAASRARAPQRTAAGRGPGAPAEARATAGPPPSRRREGRRRRAPPRRRKAAAPSREAAKGNGRRRAATEPPGTQVAEAKKAPAHRGIEPQVPAQGR